MPVTATLDPIASACASAGLTPKQAGFVALIVRGGLRPTAAARVCGYSYPDRQASRLVRMPRVAAALRAAKGIKRNTQKEDESPAGLAGGGAVFSEFRPGENRPAGTTQAGTTSVHPTQYKPCHNHPGPGPTDIPPEPAGAPGADSALDPITAEVHARWARAWSTFPKILRDARGGSAPPADFVAREVAKIRAERGAAGM